MKTIDDFNFNGHRVLMRVDFNVPLDKKTLAVTDDIRIKAAVPSIKKILQDGGSVVLMSHLGRPKGGFEDKYSMKHIVESVSKALLMEVDFIGDCVGDEVLAKAQALESGKVLLLENLRFHTEEEKGDAHFAASLATLGTCYVNDAFGTAHRAHASTAVIAAHFPGKRFAGYLMASEINNANKVMLQHQRPFTAIMGGAKVSDKLLIIENLLDKVDNLIIGGGMVYTFFKAMGGEIGKSLVEEDRLELTLSLIAKAKEKGVNLVLPPDSIVADAFDNLANRSLADNLAIPADWMGLDIGEKATTSFVNIIQASKTILWNGPMGVFEMPNFAHGTQAVAAAIANATQNGAFSLIGGGDSAAAVAKFGYQNQVSYVSTGGGALLEYFEGKILPGVAALAN